MNFDGRGRLKWIAKIRQKLLKITTQEKKSRDVKHFPLGDIILTNINL